MTLIRKLLKIYRTPLIDRLYSETDDYEIYTHFIGDEPELHEAFECPFRNDAHPSFCLYLPTRIPNVRQDAIWWIDQADGRYGNVFQFITRFAAIHYEVKLENFKEIIKFIDAEMNLGLFTSNGSVKRVRVKKTLTREVKEIRFTTRRFTAGDRKYWAKYHVIDDDLLRRYKVNSVKALLDENNVIKINYPSRHLVFAYVCFDKVKLYQPLANKALKWRNTCPSEYIFGIEQLQKKDTLIITKSLKDVMCFVGLCDVDAISPQSETQIIDDTIIEALKLKYKRIIVVMDYDRAGVMMANKLKCKGLEVRFISTLRVVINGKNTCLEKDLSDYLECKGIQEAAQLMKSWRVPLNQKYK